MDSVDVTNNTEDGHSSITVDAEEVNDEFVNRVNSLSLTTSEESVTLTNSEISLPSVNRSLNTFSDTVLEQNASQTRKINIEDCVRIKRKNGTSKIALICDNVECKKAEVDLAQCSGCSKYVCEECIQKSSHFCFTIGMLSILCN